VTAAGPARPGAKVVQAAAVVAASFAVRAHPKVIVGRAGGRVAPAGQRAKAGSLDATAAKVVVVRSGNVVPLRFHCRS